MSANLLEGDARGFTKRPFFRFTSASHLIRSRFCAQRTRVEGNDERSTGAAENAVVKDCLHADSQAHREREAEEQRAAGQAKNAAANASLSAHKTTTFEN